MMRTLRAKMVARASNFLARGVEMKITVVGRGNVGGGLAKLWEAAGHEVTALGRDGGDASDADVIAVSVPSGSITDALGKVSGVEGKIAIDTTNAYAGRDEQYESLTHEVKAATGGPVAKSFNINFAVLYDQIGDQPERPGNFYVAEDEARTVTEQLIRDAGYEPINVGGLENARLLEDQMTFTGAIMEGGLGRFFYRYWTP
jgi:predicted dinucleotide-binding enzyme